MPARLVVIEGPDRGRVLPIPPEGGLVGRGDTCAMRLGDASVSREHFRIGVRDGRPLVIDLGSTNRTRVNGEPVELRALSTGDRIEVGHSILEVVGDGEVVCTGTGTDIVVDLDAEQAARAVGQAATDAGFLGRALATMAALAEGLPATVTAAAAAELGVALVGQVLEAARVQLLRDCDGDRGQGYAVVAAVTTEDDQPAGVVQVDRALLVKVAEAGRALIAFDGPRVAVLAPLQIEGVPSLLIADRTGPPWDLAALQLVAAAGRVIGAAIDAHVRRDQVARERMSEVVDVDGDSAVSARLREWVAWLAHRPEPVLLVGEPGVGKERTAAAIHGRSPRSVGPFVAVRCAALSETWLESELFGHETPGTPRRPGKLEAARGGTLFLDELAALPPRCQKRLARALDLGFLEKAAGGRVPLDVRIIASSCHDVAGMVTIGAMREDLYRRLASQVVLVPPLRERGGDVIGLAERFLYQLAAEAGQRRNGFGPEAATRLSQHPWPGNVRELRNVIERIVLSPGEDPVGVADVERALARGWG
ncbi:MAG TPA: sigma 54-interacting transcriptional regulator [Kofleriaceae bacterium]|jgi:hypothetical protein|nr:sigma 54-interacting transcriptional regulator [Kofleriaceae bacterium]